MAKRTVTKTKSSDGSKSKTVTRSSGTKVTKSKSADGSKSKTVTRTVGAGQSPRYFAGTKITRTKTKSRGGNRSKTRTVESRTPTLTVPKGTKVIYTNPAKGRDVPLPKSK